MFTGIVEELGQVDRIDLAEESARLTLRGPLVTSDAVHGASIAVNGVCLTVVERAAGELRADLSPETLSLTNLGNLEAGSLVNLERPVTPATRLSGHLVQGHVDGEATVSIDGRLVVVNADQTFDAPVDLSKGLNVITVTAQRRYSREASIERRVVFDPQAPQTVSLLP